MLKSNIGKEIRNHAEISPSVQVCRRGGVCYLYKKHKSPLTRAFVHRGVGKYIKVSECLCYVFIIPKILNMSNQTLVFLFSFYYNKPGKTLFNSVSSKICSQFAFWNSLQGLFP